MKWYSKLILYFVPRAGEGSFDDRLMKTKALVSFAMLLASMLAVYSVATKFSLKSNELAIWELTVALFCVAVPFVFKYTGSYAWSTNLLIVNGLIILTAVSFYTGGAKSPVIFWVALCPMCAGMISGRRSVIVWGLVSLLIPSLFIYFDVQIQQYPNAIKDIMVIGPLRYRAIFGTIIFSMLFVFQYKKMHEEVLAKVTDANMKVQNLLRVVGHDISNPLSIIKMSSDLGLKAGDEGKIGKLWKKVSKASKTINEILSQVRQLQALESGKAFIDLAPISVADMVEKGKFVFDEKLSKKEIKIVFSDEGGKTKVMAEAVSFSNQVFNNILSNAIKFSKRGSTISISCKTDGKETTIFFKDGGIGIPPKILNNLFDNHFKTARTGTDGEVGTGFGMPLVKFYVEQYGGRVEVESWPIEKFKEGHGTLFKIILKKANQEDSASSIAS